MNLKPRISVIMSVFNGEETVRYAIDSILIQTFKEFEFIIINDGSTDSTLSILNEYNDSRIKIINQKNIGLTKSLNKAINLSNSLLIARQDADEISHKNRLEIQFNYFQTNKSLSIIGTQSIVKENQIETITQNIDNKKLLYNLFRKNIFIHGSVMIKKSDFQEIGMYNESFKYTQDYDAWLRLLSDNKRNGLIINKVLLTRNIIDNSISKNKYIQQAINGYIIRRKYISFLENLFITIKHISINILSPTIINFLKKKI